MTSDNNMFVFEKAEQPVNPNASPAASRLLSYLYETAGHAIITGQHTQTVPTEEI